MSEGEIKLQFALERPKSYKELFALLWEIDESRLLPLKNPDGFLYLQYLRLATIIFSICTFFFILFDPSYSLFVHLYYPSPLIHPFERVLLLVPPPLVQLSVHIYHGLPDPGRRPDQPLTRFPSPHPHLPL